MICTIDNKSSALLNLIEIFSRYDLNLLQLSSKPVYDISCECECHLDFAGNMKDQNVSNALREVDKYCISLVILDDFNNIGQQDE